MYNHEPAQLWKQIAQDVGAVVALNGTRAMLQCEHQARLFRLTAIDILIRLDNYGCTQTPAAHAYWILTGLPDVDAWVHFASTLRAMNRDSPSKLIHLENHEKSLREGSFDAATGALLAKAGNGKRSDSARDKMDGRRLAHTMGVERKDTRRPIARKAGSQRPAPSTWFEARGTAMVRWICCCNKVGDHGLTLVF